MVGMCKQLAGIPQQSAHETRAARAESKRVRQKDREKEIKRRSVKGKRDPYSLDMQDDSVHTGTPKLSAFLCFPSAV